MQLVNMEVERLGTRGASSLGPLSPGLNAIYGPTGSGKTTLLHWLRQLAVADPRRDLSSTADAAGSYRGAAVVGSVEISSRGNRFRLGDHLTTNSVYSNHWTHPGYSNSNGNRGGAASTVQVNLTLAQRDAFAAMAVSDRVNGSELEFDRIAQRLGLEVSSASLSPTPQREQLLARQREIDARLQYLNSLSTTRESLIARRDDLQRELQGAELKPNSGRSLRFEAYSNEQRRYADRIALVEADLRASETRLADLDRELASLQAELKLLDTSPRSVAVDDSYRVQLQQVDERLTRWRQTLRDLKGHRNHIEHDATEARLDRQVGEQLSATKEPDPRAPLRSLEAQILSARSQLDALVDRYSVLQDRRPTVSDRRAHEQGHRDYAVHQDAQGRTHIAYHDDYHYPDSSSLPETLRRMQKDLYEACQQLARHESRAAVETLKQQSQQLQRCESELLHAVEKLIEERDALLRKIADRYQLSDEQLSLAFGQWCNCHDHNHLQDWLLNESDVPSMHVGADPLVRQRLLDKIDEVGLARKQAKLHVEDCRRQMRDSELYRLDLVERGSEPRGRLADDIHRELSDVLSQLDQWEDRERLLREAEDIAHRLAALRPVQQNPHRFRGLVNRHIAGLMGGRQRVLARSSMGGPNDRLQRRYDLVDGIVYDQERRYEAEVPAALVWVARRLALAEAMAARAEPIPVVIDESLDHLGHEEQIIAVEYLANMASLGQQIVVLTGSQRITDLVRQQRGWIGFLKTPGTTEVDINRHLTAVANDYEAAKWYQPLTYAEPQRAVEPRGQFYLNERSRVEESPSIDGVLATRLRAVGIDRIGDLLDVDPHWLADQLRQDGVNEATVSSWQAEARLLCSVRQLRPFDARLLVSIGVRAPQQLADMHPSQLLDRVERFVATERGRRLLQSGSSYELSRITNWIASAKGGAGRFQRSNFGNSHGDDGYRHGFDGASSFDRDGRLRRSVRHGSTQSERTWHEESASDPRTLAPDQGFYDDEPSLPRRENGARRSSDHQYDSTGEHPSRSDWRRGSRTSERRSSDYPSLNRANRSKAESERVARPIVARQVRAERPESSRSERAGRERDSSDRRQPRRAEAIKLADARDDSERLKFYLELASPVVDAPSIGPRMANRLEKYGIHTVDQLLAANAESLADKLNIRRIDAATIRAWQEQARLVCRIPNLRGHDAQLLVACDLTSPEELAVMQAATVLAQILVVADSSDGQRILRGSKQPDLAEVNDWIRWAGQCRSLNAA